MKENKNQVILITGTSRGIGRYLAEYYVEKGFQVIGCSRTLIDCEWENYRHFCLDISDEFLVKMMFREIRETYGRLDVLINNAGIASMNYALLTPVSTVHALMNTNFIGTFLFCREAIKLMKKNTYGRIVNISTIHVPLHTVGSSIYSASKAAVEQFSKVLAWEVASFGITVNILGLPFVKNTDMVKGLSEGAISKALEHTILKAQIELKDVAHAMDSLISDKCDMITNQTLYLGGV